MCCALFHIFTLASLKNAIQQKIVPIPLRIVRCFYPKYQTMNGSQQGFIA